MIEPSAPQSLTGPLLLGVGLAAVTIAIAVVLPDHAALGLFGLVLGIAIGAYLFAPAKEGGRGFTDLGAALGFVALGVAGFALDPRYMAAGWVLHAGWDWLHHARFLDTGLARWVPPFCAAYDLLVGGYILVRWT